MAGKDFALRATSAAAAVIERLRGTARKNYAAFEAELRAATRGEAGRLRERQLAERRNGAWWTTGVARSHPRLE
jgi:hypothetical protein